MAIVEAFGAFGLFCAGAGYLAGLAANWNRAERAENDAECERHEARIAANRAGRHAAGVPRRDSAPARAAAITPAPRPRPPWVSWRPATPGRAVTTAADLAPVIWPQPGRTFGAGIGLLELVRSTGEMRAITDDYIAAMEADGAAYRRSIRA